MNLAAALADARRDSVAAESAVVDLLYQVLPGWLLLFPVRRSWLWTPPAELDVWNTSVTDEVAKAAAGALLAAGFTGGVTLHSHRAERFLSCACRAWRPAPRVDPRTL